MGNPVVHWELMSKAPAKVAAFYEKIFGWKVHHRPELNYRIVDTGGEGGINGGKIHVASQAVPGMGKLCLFTDPEGRMMGLWKAKT